MDGRGVWEDHTWQQSLAQLVGHHNLILDAETLHAQAANSTGVNRPGRAIIRPQTQAQVVDVVRWAAQHRRALHPLSRGANCGYGEKTAPWDDALLLDLSAMTGMVLDDTQGVVDVEPGATQQALVDLLEHHGGRWLCDVTGALPESSLIGNLVEGGYGWSPLGNRSGQVQRLCVVTGRGRVMELQTPGECASFLRTTVGVVTRARIPLLLRPACVAVLLLNIPDANALQPALGALSSLELLGQVMGVPHFSNAEKVATTGGKTRGWTGLCGLYGTHAVVRDAARTVRRALRPWARVLCVDASWVQGAHHILKHVPVLSTSRAVASLGALSDVAGLLQGRPTRRFVDDATGKPGTNGLIWLSLELEPSSGDIGHACNTLQTVFQHHHKTMPVTVAMPTQNTAVLLAGIHFDARDSAQVEQAVQLHAAAGAALASQGAYAYRVSMHAPAASVLAPERLEHLGRMKRLHDPWNIISPGRYQRPLWVNASTTSTAVVAGVAPVVVRNAASHVEAQQAARLVQQRYVAAGYHHPGDGGQEPFQLRLPETTVLVAMQEGQVVGTVAGVRDGSLRLPADSLFPEELDTIRQQGHILAELCRFAASSTPPISVRLGLTTRLFQAAWEHLVRDGGATRMVAMVNPRHVRFYQRRFGFVVVAGPRGLPSVHGAPAVLMGVELADPVSPKP